MLHRQSGEGGGGGGGGADQHYEGVCSNVISIMKGWGYPNPRKSVMLM